MTLVGKIFTVLILIMSVAFMMLAVTVFATHRNWRDLVMGTGGLKAQVEEISATNRRLREEIERANDRLAFEQAARRYALAGLQSRLEQTTQQFQQRERAYRDLQAAHGEMVETLNTNQQNLEQMTREVDGLRDQIRDTQQAHDEQLLAVVEMTERVHQLEGERQKLAERQAQLVEQVARMKNVLDKNELTEFTDVDGIAPALDGVVTAVGERSIEISLGSHDGLRKGHTLDVYRNNSYLGRIRVQYTEFDNSVGEILRDYRRGTIRVGDRVATRL